jgi:hypothetical protein
MAPKRRTTLQASEDSTGVDRLAAGRFEQWYASLHRIRRAGPTSTLAMDPSFEALLEVAAESAVDPGLQTLR